MHPRRYGGVVVLTGGLIGPPVSPLGHPGDLGGTPVFLGTSDVDPFVPLDRVRESARIFEGMGAAVELRVYPGLGHEICDDEMEACGSLLEQFR